MYDGIPVQNQNIEDIVSTRRNPVVADFMTRLDLMERRGSGFRKILDAIRREPNYKDSDFPTVNSDAYKFSFVLKDMNYGVVGNSRSAPTVTPTVTTTVKEERILRILDFCSSPKSRREIMAEIGLSDKVSFLENYIKPLIADGKLSYTQPDKPNSATQKYITTASFGK